jgi:phasin family protein
MSTTQRDKPSKKPGQRSRKADQRAQKPDQQQSPSLDQRDEDQISATVASTNGSATGAVASADAPPSGDAAPAVVPSVSTVAPVDAPSIGAGAPADAALTSTVVSVDAPSISAGAPAAVPSIGAGAPADNFPISIQTIANAYGDYTKKSLQETRSFVEKLMGVRSLDKAIEVQTEFAKQAYETFVAESQKICGLYSELAKQAFKPWEGFVAKATQAGR